MITATTEIFQEINCYSYFQTFYIIGILHQVASSFYQIDLKVEELSTPNQLPDDDGFYEFNYHLRFDNRRYMMTKAVSANGNIDPDLNHLSSSILTRLFPFSLTFGQDLQIVECGVQLRRMFPTETKTCADLTNFVRLRLPKLRLTWENVKNIIFKLHLPMQKLFVADLTPSEGPFGI